MDDTTTDILVEDEESGTVENEELDKAEDREPDVAEDGEPEVVENEEPDLEEEAERYILEDYDETESMERKESSLLEESWTEPEEDSEEEYRGKDPNNFFNDEDKMLSPYSFNEAESAEITTPEHEAYRGETSFYIDGEEGEECKYSMEEEHEEEQKSESIMSHMYTKLSPFFLKSVYGVKISTKFINLTKEDQFEVFYTASHYGVLYNYRTNTMRFLPGHNSTISSIAADASGRWLVSADDGDDNVIIIWDYQRMLPCWTLFNIFSGKGTKFVQISQDAKFLTAVSSDSRQICKFFLWTYGRDKADGEIKLGSDNGNVTNINFNHRETTQFAITMETKVMYCQWMPDKKIIEHFLAGIKKRKGKFGIFRDTLFLDDNHTAITSTNLGYMIVWSDALSVHMNDTTPGNIKKLHTKTIKIHKSGITSVILVEKIIVSSSEDGVISFHDQKLGLLYFVRKSQCEPIVSLSCNLQTLTSSHIDPFSDNFDIYDIPRSSTQSNQDLTDESGDNLMTNHTSNDKKLTSNKLKTEQDKKIERLEFPSDCTIDKKPLCSRDLMFLTWNGKLGYVGHLVQKIRYFLYKFKGTVLSMDCNPNLPHLVIGTSDGMVDLFDYRKRRRLVSNMIADTEVVTLKYSPSGRYLMAGLTNGCALLLDPILLTVKMKMNIGKAEIRKICFTTKSKMFAYFDAENIVYLFNIIGEKNKTNCSFLGRYKSHYKPIRDILFDEEQDHDDQKNEPRLYTIGEDRMLVEYDINNSQPGLLKLKRIDKIEQTAIPLCFTMLPRTSKKVTLLVSNNEYKFKVLCRNTRICYKTTLGPIADTTVKFLKVIPSQDPKSSKMIYATERHIGLRLLPVTGNPYEGMGMVGHPVKITSVAISHDYKYIFTTGLNDSCVLEWKINSSSVDIAYQLGGNGLDPFVTLIEGGTKGFLFKEMEDFFYYSHIIHQGEHAHINRTVSRNLALCEIPDFVRSLGYFPTEYEIENILRELKYSKYEETGEFVDKVTFDEGVIMYLNHRPLNGISMESINKALLSVADLGDPECIIIEKDELYKSLEQRGEPMSHEELFGYLCILLLPKNEKDPIPSSMTLKDFAEDVLGIDLTITEENVREVTHPSDNFFN